MGDNAETTLASMIPQSYFDLIGRVIPGTFVLYVYGQPEKLSWEGLVASLPFAYLIGLTLDFIGSATVEVWLNAIALKYPTFRIAPLGKIWEQINEESPELQTERRKMWAECAAFRTIFIFGLFVSVTCSWVRPHRTLTAVPLFVQFVLLATVAAVCHLRIYQILSAPTFEAPDNRASGNEAQ